jgi:hypothetical protein
MAAQAGEDSDDLDALLGEDSMYVGELAAPLSDEGVSRPAAKPDDHALSASALDDADELTVSAAAPPARRDITSPSQLSAESSTSDAEQQPTSRKPSRAALTQRQPLLTSLMQSEQGTATAWVPVGLRRIPHA